MQKTQNKKKNNNTGSKPKQNKRPPQNARNAPRAQTSAHSAPLAKSFKMKNGAPQMSRSAGSDARVTVSHREFLVDVVGSDYLVQTIPVNPGLPSTFPWLARMANSYEFYQFRSLAFEYVPLCGATDTGAIMLAMDYDAADLPPTSRQDMMNYHHAVQGSLWDQARLVSDSKNLAKFGAQRYTRGNGVPAGKDVKTYDLGNLYVATAAASATLKGSVFVSYTVELSTPHICPFDPADYSSRVLATVGVSKTQPLLNKVVTNASAETIDSTPVADAASFIVKNPGNYLIESTYSGTGLNTTMPTYNPDYATAIITTLLAGAVEGAAVITGHALRLKTTAPNQRVAVTIPAAWTTLTGLSFRLVPYAASLL